MEQHPVPQNVTTFQFRLIGDMTLKQFGYLCGGAILAYISYKLPLPFFFTWPLTVFFALLGIGFAFVPIEERPMDVWVLSFFKSIYSPTQYIWSRRPAQEPKTTTPRSLPQQPPPKTDAYSGLQILTQNTGDPMARLKNFFSPKPKIQTQKTHVPEPQKPEVPVKKEENLEQKVQEIEHELSNKTLSDNRVLELQKQLTEMLEQKRSLEDELVQLRSKIPVNEPKPAVPEKTAGVVSNPTSVSTINIIDPKAATKAGLPKLTPYPNVVTGIIKDTTGNLLPGVLVTIRDKEGVPLRALKTNKLGQFAASTQLPVGTYLVEIEDPRERYVFDRAQISVNNSVLPAIEITAKSQKELSRAKLAQQVFGNQS